MQKSDIEYLKHIKKECDFILLAIQNLDFNSFYESEVLKRATTRSFEIIGEATKNISQDFRDLYPEIPWSFMARTRDKIIHHYFGVDYIIVWETIQNKIPELQIKVENIIKEHS